MNKKLIAWSAVLIIFLLAMNVFLFIHYKQGKEESPVGKVVEATRTAGTDEISIEKKDMKACCTFERDGKSQTCYVLERFDCALCSNVCPP